jgi:hypothetical protein
MFVVKPLTISISSLMLVTNCLLQVIDYLKFVTKPLMFATTDKSQRLGDKL